jgi:hypothetical protein
LLRTLRNSFFLFCLLIEVSHSRPAPILKFKDKDNKIVSNYLIKHKDFFNKNCKPGTEEKYWNLYHRFRGDGHYIPVLEDDKLDKLTINRFLPELDRKLAWIKSKKKEIEGIKDFKKFLSEIEALEVDYEKILKLKQVGIEGKTSDERKKARNRSKYSLIKFKIRFRDFLNSIDFLTSYRFPVDHVELRETYDLVKEKRTPEERKRSNEIYFYRKIVQDGALNPDRSKSDKFLRANLDNIIREFKKSEDFISENLRYDINSAFSGLKRILKKGKNYQLRRFGEWQGRASRNIKFYKDLQENKKINGKQSAEELVKERVSGRYALKNFVLKKEAESYKYWLKESELNRALFSIETILYNEVGAIDGVDALERKDVTQVVINRRYLKEYNTIEPTEPLYDHLNLKTDGTNIESNPWLNLLLKEGEFSFTYFFIGGSLRIFCPEQTRYGKVLRKQNLYLALKLLRNPNPSFDAVRYFSRAAMLGRIDMRDLWDDFIPLPERVGKPIGKSLELKRALNRGEYQLFYEFLNETGHRYKVLEIKEKTYVFDNTSKKFYKYRNPHYFTYFKDASKQP